MSDVTNLAHVKQLTGKVIRLGIFESFGAIKQTDDTLVVTINRAQAHESRGQFRVTKRGVTAYQFRRTFLDAWIQVGRAITVWNDAEEFHSAWPGLTPEEYEAKRAWEQMCANPGTVDWPLNPEVIKRRAKF